jgi:hypothetical protein
VAIEKRWAHGGERVPAAVARRADKPIGQFKYGRSCRDAEREMTGVCLGLHGGSVACTGFPRLDAPITGRHYFGSLNGVLQDRTDIVVRHWHVNRMESQVTKIIMQLLHRPYRLWGRRTCIVLFPECHIRARTPYNHAMRTHPNLQQSQTTRLTCCCVNTK